MLMKVKCFLDRGAGRGDGRILEDYLDNSGSVLYQLQKIMHGNEYCAAEV
jgi:hypothetical protein